MAAGVGEGMSLVGSGGISVPALITQGEAEAGAEGSSPLGVVDLSEGDLQRQSKGLINPPERAL